MAMGFDLNAFLGRASQLRTWKGHLPAAAVCELGGDLGLVPLTGELFEELRARLGKEEAERLDAAQGCRTFPSPSGTEGARRWGKEASAGTTVAYVSVGEFGDDSYDKATLWSDGRELLSGVALRAILIHFRDQVGLDLGNEDIDLEKHRGDDAAEKWAAAAILKALVGQTETPIAALAVALHYERANKYIQIHVRKFAAASLARFGPAAKEAILALVRTLRTEADFGLCLEVAGALAAIGADAVPALAQVLVDGDVRKDDHSVYGKLYPAVFALSKIGAPARGAVSALVCVLGDANHHVRERAAVTLGAIGPDAGEAVSALIVALDDQDWEVRSNAAWALGRIGRAAEQAAPALRMVSSGDTNECVRRTAGEALTDIMQAGGGSMR
jgi:hypothetical protein